ncbi:hypothetical protein F8R89_35220 [Streptomyces sp. SS1-1]|uniref:hypothetical protein n=1 Tax=Streptomyces sp. KAU_LT TaxID=3046669 RepID=UPI0014147C67|nr:hypothetical protein [Streptomyces sp. KAU_LT]KAB2976809.1 hypothetical protein F8R89_35220 [Streptomyces sp. SS1-1]MDI9835142.1 hypothetical protein [Streptomyces sp. KAU_LT]
MGRYITLEWPWGAIDTSSAFRWDGRVALPHGDAHPEWSPFRLEPAASTLRVGDMCTVSIPPTRLYVGHFEEYDPPRNLGWAPPPTAGLYVVPPERTGMDMEYAGYTLYLGGSDPIRVEPIGD